MNTLRQPPVAPLIDWPFSGSRSSDQSRDGENAARRADAVIHTAFNHDFSKFAENAEQDRKAIETLGAALEGSGRPLIVTNGFGGFAQGRKAVETDGPVGGLRQSETAADAVRERGGRVSVKPVGPALMAYLADPAYFAKG